MANRNPRCPEIFLGFTSRSEEETLDLGRRIAAVVEGPLALSLEGPLGAGKTLFVQGLAEGLGVPREDVSSPSFTLVHEYAGGRIPLVHFDLYRMESQDQLVPIGFDEYLSGPGICVIEWGDKFPGVLPAGTWRIRFRIDPESRWIQASLVP